MNPAHRAGPDPGPPRRGRRVGVPGRGGQLGRRHRRARVHRAGPAGPGRGALAGGRPGRGPPGGGGCGRRRRRGHPNAAGRGRGVAAAGGIRPVRSRGAIAGRTSHTSTGDCEQAAADLRRTGRLPVRRGAGSASTRATRRPLRRALDDPDDLGAAAAARLARQRMRDLGVRSIPPGPAAATRAHPLGLTRREHEVLDLICAGRPTPRSPPRWSSPPRPSTTTCRRCWPSWASAARRPRPRARGSASPGR